MSFSKICTWMIKQKAQTWQSFWGETFLQTPWWLTYYSECLAKCSVSPNCAPRIVQNVVSFFIQPPCFWSLKLSCQISAKGLWVYAFLLVFFFIKEFRVLFKYLSLLGPLRVIQVDLYLGKLFIWFTKPLWCSGDNSVSRKLWGKSILYSSVPHWTVSWREEGMILKQRYSRYDI